MVKSGMTFNAGRKSYSGTKYYKIKMWYYSVYNLKSIKDRIRPEENQSSVRNCVIRKRSFYGAMALKVPLWDYKGWNQNPGNFRLLYFWSLLSIKCSLTNSPIYEHFIEHIKNFSSNPNRKLIFYVFLNIIIYFMNISE